MKVKRNKTALFWQVEIFNGYGSELKWVPGQNKNSIQSSFTDPNLRVEMRRCAKIPLEDFAPSEYADEVSFLFVKDKENITIEPTDKGHDYLNQYYKDYLAKMDSSDDY